MSRPLTIEAYLEALGNSRQQDPQLATLHPTSEDSTRCFRLLDHHIIFTLSDGKSLWTLTLPLGERFDVEPSIIKARVAHINRHPLFCEAHYLPSALTIFDSRGSAHTCEGLLQRAYTPLMEFLRVNCALSRQETLRTALQNLALVTRELVIEGLSHGALSREDIQFDSRGGVHLANFPFATTHSNDMEALGKAAIILYIIGCQPNTYRTFITQTTSHEEHNKRLRHILATAEYYGIESLAILTRLLTTGANDQSICTAIEALSGEPFRPMPLLLNLFAGGRNERGRVEIVTELEEPHEEVCEKVDFGTCDEVFQSDQIVRYRRGNIWGYAHYNGERIATPRVLLAAYDFVEGRAVVRTHRGYGLIDTSGRVVMNDVWEDLAWYGEENVVTACDEGRWNIYDRQGRQLSAQSADWMGDASEGYIVARRGAKFGYYSTDGQKRTDFIYDEAFSFSEGVALVVRNGIRYHIDTTFHRLTSRAEEKVKKKA